MAGQAAGEEMALLRELVPKKPVSGVLVNAMIIGLQLALDKTLGLGSAAMTQLLVRNAEEFASVLEALGIIGEVSGEPERVIPRLFRDLGISGRVEVERLNGKYRVRVWDSVFAPAAVYLGFRGVPYTINPEAFISAGVISLYHRRATGRKPRLRVRVNPPRSKEDPLVVEIEVV